MLEKSSVFAALAAIVWTIVLLSSGKDDLALGGLAALFLLSIALKVLDERNVSRRRATKS